VHPVSIVAESPTIAYLLHPSANARQRARRARANNDHVQLPVTLLQYFYGRAVLVRRRICIVRVLVEHMRVGRAAV
jgi:hypothetical protein